MQAFPYQSNYTGMDEQGNPQYDRAVGAEFFRNMWSLFFTDGIFSNPSTNFQVMASSGMDIKVKPGACFVRGVTGFEINHTELTLAMAEELVDRTDLIVLRADFTQERRLSIEVKKGTTDLRRDSDIWELQLASIKVRKSVTSIQQGDITDTRLNSAVCGVVASVIDQVDTSTIFNQYDAYWQAKQVEWANKGLAQEALWQSQMDSQESRFTSQHDDINTWWQNIQADIDLMVPFDFDNLASKPGAKRSTEFLSNGNIEESIVIALNNRKVANRNTVFNTNGSIAITQIVYKDDGAVLMQTTTTTIFNADGSITEEVS